MMEDKLLSPGEAADLLGVSRQRLTQLRDKGQVTARCVGRFWLYNQSDLERRRSEVLQRSPKLLRRPLSPGHAGVVDVKRVTPMTHTFTAVYEQVGDWWAASVEELPGANSQGHTIDEARENLKEAVQLILDVNREPAEEQMSGHTVIREALAVAT